MTHFEIVIVVLFALSGIITGAATSINESLVNKILRGIFAPIVACYLIGRAIYKILYNE